MPNVTGRSSRQKPLRCAVCEDQVHLECAKVKAPSRNYDKCFAIRGNKPTGRIKPGSSSPGGVNTVAEEDEEEEGYHDVTMDPIEPRGPPSTISVRSDGGGRMDLFIETATALLRRLVANDEARDRQQAGITNPPANARANVTGPQLLGITQARSSTQFLHCLIAAVCGCYSTERTQAATIATIFWRCEGVASIYYKSWKQQKRCV